MGTFNVELIKRVNFKPATVVDEVLQNVATILATVVYSVPYDRELGITADYLDQPIPISKARTVADVARALRRFEPRCKFEAMTWNGDAADGITKPIVKVSINE